MDIKIYSGCGCVRGLVGVSNDLFRKRILRGKKMYIQVPHKTPNDSSQEKREKR